MSWWSAVKSVVRQVVRVVIEVVHRFTFGLPNLMLGIVGWPRKKLRLHVIVLHDSGGSLIDPVHHPIQWQELIDSIKFATATFKTELNVDVVPYTSTFIDRMKKLAPTSALDVTCDANGYLAEFAEKGTFFADNLAGWNAIPLTWKFPVTVFVVRNSSPHDGCSFGPLTDYVTINLAAVSAISTMAHEIGHACGLPHWFATQQNLMYPSSPRGSHLTWLQRMIFNTSRHVRFV